MNTSVSRGQRTRTMKRFWENNAFWIVVMPTSLVAGVFLFGMLVKALGY